jgi:hypothetical protein
MTGSDPQPTDHKLIPKRYGCQRWREDEWYAYRRGSIATGTSVVFGTCNLRGTLRPYYWAGDRGEGTRRACGDGSRAGRLSAVGNGKGRLSTQGMRVAQR